MKRTNVPLNQVDAGCGVYDVADLARPENEGGIFKLLLHLTSTEKTAVHGSIIDWAGLSIDSMKISTYRSPFFLALEQSDSVRASSPRVISPDLIRRS